MRIKDKHATEKNWLEFWVLTVAWEFIQSEWNHFKMRRRTRPA